MRASGSLAGAAGAGLLLLLASAGWMAPAACAQSIVGQVTLSASGDARQPYGAGCTFDIDVWMRRCLLPSFGLIFLLYVDAKGYAYFCSGQGGVANAVVWKVDTGNTNGPSSTAPSEINRVTLTRNCLDGVVRSLTGNKDSGKITTRVLTHGAPCHATPFLRWTRMATAIGRSTSLIRILPKLPRRTATRATRTWYVCMNAWLRSRAYPHRCHPLDSWFAL